jgi:hypothetical protein
MAEWANISLLQAYSMDDLFFLSALVEQLFSIRFYVLVIFFPTLTCRCLNMVFLHIQVHSRGDVPSVMIK